MQGPSPDVGVPDEQMPADHERHQVFELLVTSTPASHGTWRRNQGESGSAPS